MGPREFVIVEGLLPLHTKLSRACFDIAIYLDPPDVLQRQGGSETPAVARAARRSPA